MAAVMAHKGHDVTGVDLNPAFVAAIQQGLPPVNEPGLAQMIQANRERLTATQDCRAAVLATDCLGSLITDAVSHRWMPGLRGG